LRQLRQIVGTLELQKQVDGVIARMETKPWPISYSHFRDGEHFSCLQYESNSLKSFEEKLTQFPSGSTFTWNADGGSLSIEDQNVIQELTDFLSKHSMSLILSK